MKTWQSACGALALVAGVASATPTTFNFSGFIIAGSSNTPGCPGLCGQNVPPAGNPISFTVRLDANLGGFVGSTSSGTDTLYDMVAPSLVDFGYRPEFAFSTYQVHIIDDKTTSAMPDQLRIYKQQAPGSVSWFDIELSADNLAFLSGAHLPTDIDLGLAFVARGSLSYSTGATSENAIFRIDSVQVVSDVPAPQTLALALMALGGLAAARRRKS